MQLLSEFLDLGPWAVAHCLTVGIFPYIVRLFHSPVSEVKPYLVFIWGKIIASAQVSKVLFFLCLVNQGSLKMMKKILCSSSECFSEIVTFH